MHEMITAPCHACRGTGRRQLSHSLAITLRSVTAEWQTSQQIHADLVERGERTLVRNTLCMRLRRLLDAQLVESRPSQSDPRGYDWRRVEPSQSAGVTHRDVKPSKGAR